MESKIFIDIDGDGAPRLRIDYKHNAEDVRDKLIGRLLSPLYDNPGVSIVRIVLEMGHQHAGGMVAFIRKAVPEGSAIGASIPPKDL